MTAHVTLKPGAETRVLAPAGIRILAAIDGAAQYLDVPLTITSGSEARGRSATDPHMTGEAFDLSVNGLSDDTLRELVRHLKTVLGIAFTVLLEGPPSAWRDDLDGELFINKAATAMHVHVQRRKGMVWP